jgi:hypothetical protein
VLPHQSPTFSPMVDAHTRWNKPSGFAQLELSRILHLLVAVCLDGIISYVLPSRNAWAMPMRLLQRGGVMCLMWCVPF